MFVDQLKPPNRARLNQILHTLSHVHQFELPTNSNLNELHLQYTAEKAAIIEGSSFNSYHANPAYVKASLIVEAVALLFAIDPSKKNQSLQESTQLKDPHMTQLVEKSHKKKPDFLDVDKDGDRKEPMTKALKDKAKKQPIEEKWGTKMHTASKDVGKWEGYTLGELKARKKKLMDKEERTAKEQKEVRQLNFAIRAKQKDSWGKIKNESVILEDQNLDQAETLLAAKDLSDRLQDMAEDAAKMAVDRLMPLVDTMKAQFGQPAAEGFNAVVKDNLQKVLDTIIDAKDQTDNAILTLQGGGTPSAATDISSELPGEEAGAAAGPELGGETGGADIDFEKEFDAMPATSGPEESPLGRAKKSELGEARQKCMECGGMMREQRGRMSCMECGGSMIAESPQDDAKRDALAKSAAEQMVKTRKKPDGKMATSQELADAKKLMSEAKTVKNPYAIGTAQAMKQTGDKPPLKKSTIKKAHEIARSIEKEVKENQNIQQLTAVLETLVSEFDSLKNKFNQHQQQFKRMVAEGKTMDPLGVGHGLEGDALLQKMQVVRKNITEAVAARKAERKKLNEAFLLKQNVSGKIENLNSQLSTQPYGVVAVDKRDQKIRKFFESETHRNMWMDFNKRMLKEYQLIDPKDIKNLQQRLKKMI